ncbi:RsmB/NOP family class I SAM-dependent RNA methyltransferase [Hansschlegelia sp.]|uniref:RsmB/NOP family class I SAM-dependent RNA methyltransferase n=1 Tax=Hansschlegelia sp. TaxID=2041892 RepID=UPI002C545CFD|nr:transcription antitermination factor NusB [Hansschlegelia sp.]HVI27220.1 transcription antitermination factor NusB [Hansschlegelia sp.]
MPGLAPRRVAARLVDGVLSRTRSLDASLEIEHDPCDFRALDPRDRALARAIAGVTLRRLGTLRSLVAGKLEKGLPKKAGLLEAILVTGAAQALYMQAPAHTAVDLAVATARADPDARHFAGLANAVLRGIVADGLPAERPGADVPGWLYARWSRSYGADVAARIAASVGVEPALDLSVKENPAQWAERLGGVALPTGSVRLVASGLVSALEGFAEGAWWVQDAAAALPARLFGDLDGRSVIDLCAAPGGKTAQLAAAGAEVVAVDKSAERLMRLSQNLSRLGLSAATRVADAATLSAEPADAVLLDAPCSATGTTRRHPDVGWLKRESDIAGLARVQAQLLDCAVKLVKPGGLLVYCVCSLEPEEGERQIAALLARNPRVSVEPARAEELPGIEDAIDATGCVRTLPFHFPHEDPRLAGCDGFFMARLRVG